MDEATKELIKNLMVDNMDINSRIENISKAFLPKSYQEYPEITNRWYGNDAGINGMSPQTYGTNLTAAPLNYLDEKYTGKINSSFDEVSARAWYEPGKDKISMSGIYDNILHPLATLSHEMQHSKQWTRPLNFKYDKFKGEYTPSAIRAQKQDKTEAERIKAQFKQEYKEGRFDKSKDIPERVSFTGQDTIDEIAAQFKSYESALPAGMSMFQSPVGQRYFATPEGKLWWINQNNPSMSDQTYLEGLRKKQEKTNKK